VQATLFIIYLIIMQHTMYTYTRIYSIIFNCNPVRAASPRACAWFIEIVLGQKLYVCNRFAKSVCVCLSTHMTNQLHSAWFLDIYVCIAYVIFSGN